MCYRLIKTAVATSTPKKRKWQNKPFAHSQKKKDYNAKMKTPIIAERTIPTTLAKTDNQRLKELKQMLIESAGSGVVQKVIDIALNDDHPGQMAAIKMCIDRTLPVSMFDKEKNQRSAVTINITGLDIAPITIDATDE